jgi:hypothetical protein
MITITITEEDMTDNQEYATANGKIEWELINNPKILKGLNMTTVFNIFLVLDGTRTHIARLSKKTCDGYGDNYFFSTHPRRKKTNGGWTTFEEAIQYYQNNSTHLFWL